jgi:iron complex outermembrane receptor protein
LKNTAGRERNFTLSAGIDASNIRSSITVSRFHQKAGLFAGAIGIPRGYELEPDGDNRNIDLPRQRTTHLKVISNTVYNMGKNWLEADLGYQENDRREEGQPHVHGYQPTPEGNVALALQLSTLSANLRYNIAAADNLVTTIGFQGQHQQNEHGGFEFLLPDFLSGNAGLYTYLEYSPSHVLSLSGGARYDYGWRDIAAQRGPNYITAQEGDSITNNPAINRQYHDLSAAFGLSYSPNIYFNTKLNLGSSFRMPTAIELSSNGLHHGTFRYELGDPRLDSERGLQADLNFTYSKDKLYASITTFAGYFHRFIYLTPMPYFVPTEQGEPPFENYPLQPVSPAGGQLHQYRQSDAFFTGFEWQGQYDISPSVNVQTSAEYVWNRNLEFDRPLPLTPPFSFFAALEYRPAWESKTFSDCYFSISGHAFSAQRRVDLNEAATDGYMLLALQAGATMKIYGQALQWRLNIDNLTNERYMNHLSRYRLLNLPEQGFNAMISLLVPLEFY